MCNLSSVFAAVELHAAAHEVWASQAERPRVVLLLTPNEPVPAPHSMLLTMSGVHLGGAPGSWALTE